MITIWICAILLLVTGLVLLLYSGGHWINEFCDRVASSQRHNWRIVWLHSAALLVAATAILGAAIVIYRLLGGAP